MPKDFFTVMTNNDEFIYFDMGDLKFDKKLPRRSGTAFTMEDAETVMAKAERSRVAEYQFYKNQAVKWDDDIEDNIRHMERLMKKAEKFNSTTFKIIKVTYTEVG